MKVEMFWDDDGVWEVIDEERVEDLMGMYGESIKKNGSVWYIGGGAPPEGAGWCIVEGESVEECIKKYEEEYSCLLSFSYKGEWMNIKDYEMEVDY